MDVYEQVREKALPIIKAYHDDLIRHDRKAIEESPGISFLHFTGDTGTYIALMVPAEAYPPKGVSVPYLFGRAERFHILRQYVKTVECMKTINRQDMILYCNGKRLIEINQERAENLAWKYQWRILNEWEKTERKERDYEAKHSGTVSRENDFKL